MSDDKQQPDEKWCRECKRLREIACTCGMTFAEKIRHVAIDTSWMPNAGSPGGTMGD